MKEITEDIKRDVIKSKNMVNNRSKINTKKNRNKNINKMKRQIEELQSLQKQITLENNTLEEILSSKPIKITNHIMSEELNEIIKPDIKLAFNKTTKNNMPEYEYKKLIDTNIKTLLVNGGITQRSLEKLILNVKNTIKNYN